MHARTRARTHAHTHARTHLLVLVQGVGKGEEPPLAVLEAALGAHVLEEAGPGPPQELGGIQVGLVLGVLGINPVSVAGLVGTGRHLVVVVVVAAVIVIVGGGPPAGPSPPHNLGRDGVLLAGAVPSQKIGRVARVGQHPPPLEATVPLPPPLEADQGIHLPVVVVVVAGMMMGTELGLGLSGGGHRGAPLPPPPGAVAVAVLALVLVLVHAHDAGIGQLLLQDGGGKDEVPPAAPTSP